MTPTGSSAPPGADACPVAKPCSRGACNDRTPLPGAGFDHNAESVWKVFDSRCPHQTTNIPHLALNGASLTCPKHGWVFDVRTGECTENGDSPLVRWECKLADGRLLARW